MAFSESVKVGKGLNRKEIKDLNEEEWCNHYMEKIRNKHSGCEEDPVGVCWDFVGRSKRGSRYKCIDVTIPGIGQTVRAAHRVAYMTSIAGSWSLPSELEVSHLCCRPSCVRPAHLVLESREENQSRRGCNSLQRCLGHGTRPECIFQTRVRDQDCSSPGPSG